MTDDLRTELELLRHMQLDSIKRADRYEKQFQALRAAIVHSIHNRRMEMQESMERIDQMFEEFFDDLEKGDIPSNGDNES